MGSLEAFHVPDEHESVADEPERDFAGALHEVSNTLTVLLGWLDVAYAKLEPGGVREAVEVARTHAHLGYRIARRAIGAEMPALEQLERSAASLARTAVLGVEPQAQRRGVRLQIDARADADVAVRDVTPVLQILTNLLLNAIAFSPKDSVVELRVIVDPHDVRYSVSDSGAGIEAARAKTLLAAPDSTRWGGAGLGLRHSSALAAAKGGELRLTRSSPGAEFELRWPLAASGSGPRQRAVRSGGIQGARVLVIEDDPAVRSLIELTLEARGATTLIVSSVADVRRLAGARAVFDVALMDLSPLGNEMPDVIGLLRRANPSVRLIVISGSTARLSNDVESELSGWVRKPFEMDEVIEVIASALERQRAAG